MSHISRTVKWSQEKNPSKVELLQHLCYAIKLYYLKKKKLWKRTTDRISNSSCFYDSHFFFYQWCFEFQTRIFEWIRKILDSHEIVSRDNVFMPCMKRTFSQNCMQISVKSILSLNFLHHYFITRHRSKHVTENVYKLGWFFSPLSFFQYQPKILLDMAKEKFPESHRP